jgi:hypothetical protein
MARVKNSYDRDHQTHAQSDRLEESRDIKANIVMRARWVKKTEVEARLAISTEDLMTRLPDIQFQRNTHGSRRIAPAQFRPLKGSLRASDRH